MQMNNSIINAVCLKACCVWPILTCIQETSMKPDSTGMDHESDVPAHNPFKQWSYHPRTDGVTRYPVGSKHCDECDLREVT